MSSTEAANEVDLSTYRQGDYDPGSLLRRVFWYVISLVFFENLIPWPQGLKASLLRCFGAEVGTGLVIKPRVRIKFPWKLRIGEHTWLGEDLWIDNVAPVRLGSHVCLSQGVALFTGNHDRSLPSFDLIEGPIRIDDGAWIGARAMLCPGTVVETLAVLNAGGVGKGRLEASGIYGGNPAERIGTREIVGPGKGSRDS